MSKSEEVDKHLGESLQICFSVFLTHSLNGLLCLWIVRCVKPKTNLKLPPFAASQMFWCSDYKISLAFFAC